MSKKYDLRDLFNREYYAGYDVIVTLKEIAKRVGSTLKSSFSYNTWLLCKLFELFLRGVYEAQAEEKQSLRVTLSFRLDKPIYKDRVNLTLQTSNNELNISGVHNNYIIPLISLVCNYISFDKIEMVKSITTTYFLEDIVRKNRTEEYLIEAYFHKGVLRISHLFFHEEQNSFYTSIDIDYNTYNNLTIDDASIGDIDELIQYFIKSNVPVILRFTYWIIDNSLSLEICDVKDFSIYSVANFTLLGIQLDEFISIMERIENYHKEDYLITNIYKKKNENENIYMLILSRYI